MKDGVGGYGASGSWNLQCNRLVAGRVGGDVALLADAGRIGSEDEAVFAAFYFGGLARAR